jgi:predicted nuclease of predicted toxin-antitoxin system
MKIVLDMNLSPRWVDAIQELGHEACHWSGVGPATAPDREIMTWARTNGDIVMTHDLDFGAILAATGARAPNVIQFRTQDPTPSRWKDTLVGGRRGWSWR